MPGDTITKRFQDQVRAMGDRPAMHHRAGDEWRTITWAEYGTAVRETALGLAAIGVAPGQAVAILSANRPEWHVADMAAMSTGVPNASPMTKGNKPPASASHGMEENTMTARAIRQMKTPKKKVRRRPSASVNEPANKVKIVIAGAQTQPIRAPAD